MTVIAWDGRTLAADKLADMAGLRTSVTKISRVNGCLIGSAGASSVGNEAEAWFARGADPKDFPESQRDNEHWDGLLVITPEGAVLKYENTPYPVRLDPGQKVAIGSGRDFAVAAMHLGLSATEAVKLACELSTGCGNGIDFMTL